ncbi:hypothetical protein BC629DRAFT_1443204 [Irpex lacteus]|nr:hypothetical protein BC629DRAFT_1443204 [Irpex lacteus]
MLLEACANSGERPASVCLPMDGYGGARPPDAASGPPEAIKSKSPLSGCLDEASLPRGLPRPRDSSQGANLLCDISQTRSQYTTTRRRRGNVHGMIFACLLYCVYRRQNGANGHMVRYAVYYNIGHLHSRDTTYEHNLPVPKVQKESLEGPAYGHSLPVPKAHIVRKREPPIQKTKQGAYGTGCTSEGGGTSRGGRVSRGRQDEQGQQGEQGQAGSGEWTREYELTREGEQTREYEQMGLVEGSACRRGESEQTREGSEKREGMRGASHSFPPFIHFPRGRHPGVYVHPISVSTSTLTFES